MRLDETHRDWLVITVVFTLASSLGYTIYAMTTPGGPSGDTWVGLTFGVLGSGMIFFAGLLGARKKILLLRIGSLSGWMRGHLWLGALSLPMVLFHAAFEFGGLLTTVLMWLLFLIVVSGVVGAALQHALPGVMTDQVIKEHTYEQMERLRLSLRIEAYELVAAVCGPVSEVQQERTELESNAGYALREPKKVTPIEGDATVKGLYVHTILPYLRNPNNGSSPLVSANGASMLFDNLKPRLDPALHETVDNLAEICNEVRQQTRQIRLHRILHGWLLLHIPLSMALLVLIVVHAVMALYY